MKLINSYLTERSQVVRVNGEISNSEKITSGVPQGSILGPLFLLVFINDLPDKCNTVIPFLFADEAKFISINLGRDEFQKDLDNVNLWTLENNMPFNVDKCTHLNFGKNRFSFIFNNEQIAHVDCQKDLELIVSNDLTWSQHMEKACVKANRVFFMIKRNTSNLHWKAKLILYKSMVIPVIMYASSCIGLSKYVMTQYEIIQKRAVNWILHSKHTNYKDKLKRLQILPLPTYIKLNNLLLLAKLILKRYDTYMIDVPQYIDFSRHPMFQLKRPSKYRCEQNFFYQTCRLANALRIDLRNWSGLKGALLKVFWNKFALYDERNKCTWKLACDCATNNCRTRLAI